MRSYEAHLNALVGVFVLALWVALFYGFYDSTLSLAAMLLQRPVPVYYLVVAVPLVGLLYVLDRGPYRLQVALSSLSSIFYGLLWAGLGSKAGSVYVFRFLFYLFLFSFFSLLRPVRERWEQGEGAQEPEAKDKVGES